MVALFVYEKDMHDPTPDIPSLEGKVIFVTGGTAGLGKSTILALLAHNPSRIYFSGRSHASAKALIEAAAAISSPASSSAASSPPPLTFIPLDQTSLPSIRAAIRKHFTHTRLDILINNAGIMAGAAGLSADGYEIQFATNHLGHAMIVRELLPVLLRTAEGSGSGSSSSGGGGSDAPADVRIINLTSVGYQAHPSDGISFDTLSTTQAGPPVLGQWIRYGQSKLANILYTRSLARRHPTITTLAIHPGLVNTGLVTNQSRLNRLLVYLPQKIMGSTVLTPEQGCWNQVWAAAAAKKADLVNGGFYMPVGHLADDKLGGMATDDELAGRLWRWSEDVLDRVE